MILEVKANGIRKPSGEVFMCSVSEELGVVGGRTVCCMSRSWDLWSSLYLKVKVLVVGPGAS